jgi:hypothetical protein
LRYLLAGRMGKNRFDRINLEPKNSLKTRHVHTSQVHALLGGVMERRTPKWKNVILP